jgi:hypothetical protein
VDVFNPVVIEKEPRPPIVNAPFIKANEVVDRVRPEELVLGIVIAGEARAYPINMLVGPEREIINDTISYTNAWESFYPNSRRVPLS